GWRRPCRPERGCRTRQAAVLPGIRGNSCFTNGWGTAAGGRRGRAGNGPRARLAGAVLSPKGGRACKTTPPTHRSYTWTPRQPGEPPFATAFADRPDRIHSPTGTARIQPLPGAGSRADRRHGVQPAARPGRTDQRPAGRRRGRRLPGRRRRPDAAGPPRALAEAPGAEIGRAAGRAGAYADGLASRCIARG